MDIYGTFNMWKEVFRDEKFFKHFKIFKFISTIDYLKKEKENINNF